MSVNGWIITSIIGLLIAFSYTLIVKSLCSRFIDDVPGNFFSIFLFGGPNSYPNPAATIITVFSGITSAIASVLAVILYCKKIPDNITIILILYGSVILCTIIQFLIRYIQEDVIDADDLYIKITGIIIGIIFSIGLIIFGSFSIAKESFPKFSQNEIIIESESTVTNQVEKKKLLKKNQKQEIKEQKIIEKQKQKELQLKDRIEKKQIRFEIRTKRKEKIKLFFSENKKTIIAVTITSIILIVIILIVSSYIYKKKVEEQKHYREEQEKLKAQQRKLRKEQLEKERLIRITEIASYFIERNENPECITLYENIICEYENNQKDFNRKINKAEKDWKKEYNDRSLFNFGHRERVEDKEDLYKNAKSEKAKFERSNKNSYLKAKCFLDSLPKGYLSFFDKHKCEILEEYKLILKKQKEDAEREFQESHKQAIQSVEEDRRLINEKAEKQRKIEKVLRAIKELGDLIDSMKTQVLEKKTISIKSISFLRTSLNNIVKLKDYIPSEEIKILKQIKMILMDTFEKTENINDIKVEIQIIDSLFNEILNNNN